MKSYPLNRRVFGTAFLATLVGTPLFGMATSVAAKEIPGSPLAPEAFLALERRTGSRIGIKAIDTGTGATVAYRGDERFPMCSTHKFLVGAAVLAMVEAGRLRLDQDVPYGQADLLEYAPITKQHVGAGSTTVEALCEAAVRWSDNTADNLLLGLIGGPAGWTRYARRIGDQVSRLDRIEPELNASTPGDDRDTSTPNAMTASLATVLLGGALTDSSGTRLKGWMYDSEITKPLFREALPEGWHVADKSGAGGNGSRNDVGILYPPSAAPLIVSVFTTGSAAPMAARDAIVAECAAIVLRALR